MKRGHWRQQEIQGLRRLLSLNTNLKEAAVLLDRPYFGVIGQIRRMRQRRELEGKFREIRSGHNHCIYLDDEITALIHMLTSELMGPVSMSKRVTTMARKLKKALCDDNLD